MKFLSSLISQNNSSQVDIKTLINSMMPEIETTFSSQFNKDVSDLLENLANMSDIIEANFSQIKDILHQNKQEIINAITTENNKDIA